MTKQSNTLRVAIVDDDPDDIFLTKALCKRSALPIDWVSFSSGCALLDFIKKKGTGSFDLILLDINMPLENGYNVLRRLQIYQHVDDLNVVMFSTLASSNEKQLAAELGAKGIIRKPALIKDANPLFDLLSSCYHERLPVLQLAE